MAFNDCDCVDPRCPLSHTGPRADFLELLEAVKALYYAAHWTPDRDCDARKLWEDVANAAGFIPGQAPKPRERNLPSLTGNSWGLGND